MLRVSRFPAIIRWRWSDFNQVQLEAKDLHERVAILNKTKKRLPLVTLNGAPKKFCKQCQCTKEGHFLKSKDGLRQTFFCNGCIASNGLTPDSVAPAGPIFRRMG